MVILSMIEDLLGDGLDHGVLCNRRSDDNNGYRLDTIESRLLCSSVIVGTSVFCIPKGIIADNGRLRFN